MTSGVARQAHGSFGRLGPGSRIAGYLIEEQIGAGGMAAVFRAREESLGRPAALKVIAPLMAGDEEFRARFLRESRAAAAVDSPYIVPVYSAGEDQGLLYIATRFVAGGDLAELVRHSGGPLAVSQAVSLVSQVASALDAAHAAGLVHRDVKPGNILVDTVPGRPEHAYLSDFGLSKSMASTGLTASGQFLGTPDYGAPEQIKSAQVDGRADQYALACVAFKLLTGVVPFHRSDTAATLFAHLQDPVPPATGLQPDLPAAVDGVIARALAKSPADRYRSCGEFAAALQEALSPASPAVGGGRRYGPTETTDRPAATGESVAHASTITAEEGTPARHRSHGRKRARAIWAASTATVLAAGIAAAVVLYPSSDPNAGKVIAYHVLAGSKYGFNGAEGIAVDGADVWVANLKGNSVTELNASDGTLVRTLSGAKYGFSYPFDIAFDGRRIWVTNNNSVTELTTGLPAERLAYEPSPHRAPVGHRHAGPATALGTIGTCTEAARSPSPGPPEAVLLRLPPGHSPDGREPRRHCCTRPASGSARPRVPYLVTGDGR